ncbi:hypothetical protein B0H16DRAFT_1634191 [Mycena metata]|uniref:Uncharacterized protein n=1 Tax=Mycena metata TaxID=1033252 RepID=A0AAD7M9N8_9AGAR|nr:hypothetical protein B0H16DRAFT_1634191 [Mycena metata]
MSSILWPHFYPLCSIQDMTAPSAEEKMLKTFAGVGIEDSAYQLPLQDDRAPINLKFAPLNLPLEMHNVLVQYAPTLLLISRHENGRGKWIGRCVRSRLQFTLLMYLSSPCAVCAGILCADLVSSTGDTSCVSLTHPQFSVRPVVVLLHNMRADGVCFEFPQILHARGPPRRPQMRGRPMPLRPHPSPFFLPPCSLPLPPSGARPLQARAKSDGRPDCDVLRVRNANRALRVQVSGATAWTRSARSPCPPSNW